MIIPISNGGFTLFGFNPDIGINNVTHAQTQNISAIRTACSVFTDFFSGIFAGCITKGVIRLGGTVLALAGMLFNIFIAFTLNPEFHRIGLIENTWTTMRDLANLTFIFGMIAVGFMMILGGSVGNWKNTLKRLIIIALLLNFSLFASRVVIDAGNIVGGFFYNQLTSEKTSPDVNATTALSSAPAKISSTNTRVYDVSGDIVSKLNLVELLHVDTINNLSKNGEFQSFLFMFNVIFLTTALVGSWSLATTAFLFLSRTVNLMILSIVSPLAFVAYFIPQGQNLAHKWFRELINKSFCVVVYLFFIYLLIQILGGSVTELNEVGLQTNANSASKSFSVILVNISIVLSFIFGVLGIANKQAKKMCEGEMGGVGGMVLKAGKTLALGVAGGAALGAGAFALRKFAAGATSGIDREKNKKAAATSRMARMKLRLADIADTSKFGGSASNKDAEKKRRDKLKAYNKRVGVDQDVINPTTGETEFSKDKYLEETAKGGVLTQMTGIKGRKAKDAEAMLEEAKKKEASKASNQLDNIKQGEDSEITKAAAKRDSKLMVIEQQEKKALEEELKLAKGKGLNVNILEGDSIERAIHGGDVSQIEATHESLDALKSINAQMKANSDEVPLLQKKLENAKTDMNAGNIATEVQRAFAKDPSMSKAQHREIIDKKRIEKHDEIKGQLDTIAKANDTLQKDLDRKQREINSSIEEAKKVAQESINNLATFKDQKAQVDQEFTNEKDKIRAKNQGIKDKLSKKKKKEKQREDAQILAQARKDLDADDGDNKKDSGNTKKNDSDDA